MNNPDVGMSRVWETTAQLAARLRRHQVTVRRAAESGELHGHQAQRGSQWRFAPEAGDAWITGQNGAIACGCKRRALRTA